MHKQIFSTDWLGSRPVFYNDLLGLISHQVNDVIDHKNITFHPEGLNNYLDFGYSVFGQTPVDNVKFLPHSSSILLDKNNQIQVETATDPVEKWIGHVSHEDDVLHSIFTAIHEWENQNEGPIIIPTSGGLDSRLLNLCIKDKSRIHSFTYGFSYDQKKSFEVVYAQTLSKILGTKWQQIELGEYHKYIDLWYNHFGISTHAHGMYQIEFYSKILSIVGNNAPLLSGIIGDAWAGGVTIPTPVKEQDILSLSYSHGLHADSKYSRLSNKTTMLKNFWEQHKISLQEPLFRLVWSMRFKILLLSYLLTIPRALGFKPWSPFLDENIAMGMATLPSHRRKDRIWQKDFFEKNGVNIEQMIAPADTSNTLNYQALKNIPVPPLDVSILNDMINPNYTRLINATLKRFITYNEMPPTLNKNDFDTCKYYCAYLTLKPLEMLININKKQDKTDNQKTHSINTNTKSQLQVLNKTQNKSALLESYDESYFNWQKNIGKFGGKANLFKFTDEITDNDSVLDFGCGGGYLLANIQCKDKFGIEINEFARREAQKNGIRVFNNIEDIDDFSIDVIISNHALEHVPNPLETITDLFKKLKNNGKIVFVVPHQNIIEEFNENDINKHLYTWNKQTLGNIFQAAGFKKCLVITIQHQWPHNYKEIYDTYGENEFHKICREHAINNNNFQIKIIAKKEQKTLIHNSINTPVILVTYNRPRHTAKVLKSLKDHNIKNLIIYSDAPKNPEQEKNVLITRRILEDIDWIKPNIVFQNTNQGLAKSIISAANHALENHDRFILLEDDCVPAEHFFRFMDKCLNAYENNESIYGISGYSTPIPTQLLNSHPYDIYFHPRIGSWGWATWKRAWKTYSTDLKKIYNECIQRNVDINIGGNDVYYMIKKKFLEQSFDVWTLNWILSVYKNSGYYIYPTQSHIINIGLDGSGVHCGKTTKYNTVIAEKEPRRFPSEIYLDVNLINTMNKYFDGPYVTLEMTNKYNLCDT